MSVATRCSSSVSTSTSGVWGSSNCPKVSSSFPRTFSSGVRESAAIDRPDELEREPDRTRLERREPRREAEDVAVQLLVDAHHVVVELGVDRVAPAAEVDEVEQRQCLHQLLGGTEKRARARRRRAPPPGPRRTPRGGGRAAPAGRRTARARRPAPAGRHRRDRRARPLPREPRRLALVSLAQPASASATASRSSSGSSGTRAAVLPQHPAGERLDAAYSVSKMPSSSVPASCSVRATHHAVSPFTSIRAVPATSPILPAAPTRYSSMSKSTRETEVALAPGGEADVAADARDAERAAVVVVEVVADDVPGASVVQQRVRVERPLARPGRARATSS